MVAAASGHVRWLHLTLCCALLLTAGAAAPFTVVNLIPNGSFETLTPTTPYGPNCDSTGASYAFGCNDSIAVDLVPWHITGQLDVLIGLQTTYVNCTDGSYCFDLNSNIAYNGAGVYAPLTVTKGQPYEFSIDIGGTTGSCGCSSTPIRNISIQFSPFNNASNPFALLVGSVDLSDDVCKWTTYTDKLVMDEADVLLNIQSLVPPNWCGPTIDRLRLYWVPCIDGRPPPASGTGYNITCSDGWIVTPPPVATPLTVTAPIVIEGPLSLPQLNVTFGNSLDGALIQVTGNVTLDGVLIIELGNNTVQNGDSWAILEAADISGDFVSINVTRNQASDCVQAQTAQSAGRLAALFSTDACSTGGKKENGLKPWHIALITVGFILVIAAVAAGVFMLFGVHKKRKSKPYSSEKHVIHL